MNSVVLIGRLARDVEMRYNGENPVARMTIAVDRDNKDEKADFIPIVCFGKQAEICERYLAKGRQIAIEGRIQTGSYKNKDGETVYATNVVARKVEFLGRKDDIASVPREEHAFEETPRKSKFEEAEADIPF